MAATTFSVMLDVLQGDATVEAKVTITTRVVGSLGEDHTLARAEAVQAIIEAIKKAEKESKDTGDFYRDGLEPREEKGGQ